MAEGLTPEPPEPEAAPVAPQPTPGAVVTADLRPKPRPLHGPPATYGRRFLAVYLLLGLILGGGIAGLVLILPGKSGKAAGNWSAWHPTASGGARANQIADFVSRRYQLPNGKQLVLVTAGKPVVQNLNVERIVIQLPAKPKQSSKQQAQQPAYQVIRTSHSVEYVLCGLGQGCAIEEGQPTVERARVLRREALELALYTFKYDRTVDSVLALLPPKPGSAPTFSLLFRKQDLHDQLGRPLVQTLQGIPRIVIGKEQIEQGLIDNLTNPRLFKYTYRQWIDGTVALLLAPVEL